MTFLAPERLVLLVPVAALAAAYVAVQLRRRPTYAVRFTDLALLDVVAPERPAWRRHVTAAALLAGLAALVVALAEPAHDATVRRERATVVLAVDVSLSMDATDVEPNRLEAAKAAALDFLDTVPPRVNVGLVRFAGSAAVLVAPTTDHDEVRRAVQGLRVAEGTAIGEAVHAALDALALLPPAADPDEPVPASVILLSDGESTVGRSPEGAARAAAEAGVPVSTIAFGTTAGVVTIEGEKIPVPPDLATLRDIARITGGDSFEAGSGDELREAYRELASSVGLTTEQREIGEWFVAAALAVLGAAAALSLRWSPRLP